MSAHEGEVVDEIEIGTNETNDEKGVRLSPDLVNEKTKARFQLLHAQVC